MKIQSTTIFFRKQWLSYSIVAAVLFFIAKESHVNAADSVINPIPQTGSPFPGDVNFPTDPINDPINDPIGWDPNLPPIGAGDDPFGYGGYGYPSVMKSGASERVALEVLFQTLTF